MNLTTKSGLFALLLALLPNAAHAEKKYGPGVSDTEIKIGQTMPYSGPLSNFGTFGRAEAAYFDQINSQGGINGRRIKLISLDDGYNPAKTVEQTRKLIEQEEVLLIFSSLGTATNSAIHQYLNGKQVPHLFLVSGAGKWADPQRYPWTMPWPPAYQNEAKLYAQYLLRNKPEAKVALLYQNDDSGKDYLRGFKERLGDRAAKMIVAEVSYLPTDPTVDSQVISMKGSGADTFLNFAIGKAAAQAIRKAAEIGWKPLQLLTYTSNSVETVLKPAGLGNAAGTISSGFAKDPTDPQWKDDTPVRQWHAWMQRYYPDGNPNDIINVYGYTSAQMLVQVLQQCGDNLTRENVMRQAANLKQLELPLLLPSIRVNTSPTDFLPIKQAQLMRFDGSRWVRFGDVVQP
jgi:branched-chain amino acid transport system substrate-binding protein